MKTEKRILIAFLLNLFFSILEFIGGWLTGSVAIFSDALHDLGDAVAIGLSYFLERKSVRRGDNFYSALGGLITTLILLLGSLAVMLQAILRLHTPTAIRYDGMILFAIVGVAINAVAAFVTREGRSVNRRAVNLHMLEDLLGWLVVLVGAIVMRFTDWVFLDPLLSIGVSLFILIGACANLRESLFLLRHKTPADQAKPHHFHHHHH